MQITTKNIIKALPFDERFKMELLNEFDFLTPDQKFTITRLMWDTFQAIFTIKLDENMQKALQDVEEEKEKLNNTLYNKVRQRTLQQLENDLEANLSNIDLAAARHAIETIIDELKIFRASKKHN